MASDKKKTVSKSSRSRRNDSDRRDTSNRRKSDNRRSLSETPTKDRSLKPKKSSVFKRFFKFIIFLFVVFVLLMTGLSIFLFSNLDYFVSKISNQVIVKLEHASIDPLSLTQRVCRAKLILGMKNNLPIGLVFRNLKYNVKLSNYQIASGMQAKPMLVLPANTYKRLPIKFHVNSIKTRRALQKVVRQNTVGLLQIMLSKINGKTKSLANDVKEIIKIDGTADFRITIFGLQIPFTKKIIFNSK